MHLSSLTLENFRSYSKKSLNFSPGINLILGDNGTGKTNILESIYFLSSGKSFRSSSLSQLVRWDSTYTFVNGLLSDGTDLEVQLIKDPNKTTLGRKFYLNKVVKTRPKYLGTFKTVVFEPEDIRLVTGSPSRRRDFLDSVFATTEWRYAGALSQFNRALKHRNELLDMIRDGKSSRQELFYWDQSLIKNDGIIHDFRLKFFKSLNGYFSKHDNSEIRTISLNYHPSFLTQEKLDQNYSYELACGYTQSGVHRDDFSFENDIFSASDKNLAFWGSRGQQRLAVLALRLGQISYLEDSYSQKPILLLDDIFSELDDQHQNLVVETCHNYQTILTSADKDIQLKLPTAQTLNI